MTSKHNFKGKLVVMIAVLALSGCSSSKKIRSKNIKRPSVTSEIVQPQAKPSLLSQEIDNLLDLPTLPRNNYLLDQNKTLEIAISEYGYTRFFFEGERVTDVFVYPQENLEVRIHKQGYLNVVPKQQQESEEEEENSSTEIIYLTVTGENGTTQDFSLRFTGKSPEPVKFVKSSLGNNKINIGR